MQLSKWLKRIGRGALAIAWALLALWTTLAIFYTAPVSRWLATGLAVAAAGVFVAAYRMRGARVLGGIVFAVVAVWFTFIIQPNPDQDWAADHARVPRVTIEGDIVRVQDVRNFTWRSRSDFDEKFDDRVYDAGAITSVYYLVVPLAEFDGIAHVFVCFGFRDGQHVAVSVEGRRVRGIPYQVIPSMFHQYQLIYVVGDERDVVGVRGAVWKLPVRFYPATSTPERKKALFLDMMQRACSLEKKPEFYNLITNNCMNNITDHLRTLGYRPLPPDLFLLMTGFSDRAAFRLGYIDTDLTFEQAREAFRIDKWMQTQPLDATFSIRLREQIDRQVDEIRARPLK